MSNRHVALKEKPSRGPHAHVALAAVASVNDMAATPQKWACHHHINGSEIEAYVFARNGLEVIAETKHMDGVSARANAELIVQAINNHEKYRPLIAELIGALELCLQSDKLTWEVEQEADAVCRKARRMVGL